MAAPTLTPPPRTVQSQRRASDPARSAWVSANAGSGKTFVLTRRVVRLLLAGVPPSRILCLTFTKAAAANMSIRVFETLAAWVTLDDAALAAAVVDTGAPRPDAAALAAARRLFARTVESPGGLKIQTIHAFCEKLLHAFPFEANVAARFAVIEEVRQAEFLSRAREAVLARAVAEPDDALGRAVADLGRDLSGASFADLVGATLKHAGALRGALARSGGPHGLASALAEALGTERRGVAAIERAMVEDGLPRSEWRAVALALGAEEGGRDTAANRLLTAAVAGDEDRLDRYLDVFLTGKLEPRADSYLPKSLRVRAGALCDRLDDERRRVFALVIQRRTAVTLERSHALLTVAEAVLARYEAMKRARGLLDFDDLIERSRLLLARSDAAWVLYKLDRGVEHILVDEAQDTSPGQWEILNAISRDFFAGKGRTDAIRTFFAVGDEKQSIYSFQGARPAMFDGARQDYARRAEEARLAFESVTLDLSFRSARVVLDLVDRVFAHPDNAKGLTAGSGAAPTHEALKTALPGLVEIWRPVGPTAAADPADWRLPVDVPEASDPAVVLARRVADKVRVLVGPGSPDTVEDSDTRRRRPVRPSDVLILVRSRNAFFDAVIRALKDRHVPVAGADRLSLTGHIAVMDLAAAGRAALLPDDDLTLACLLKSPLVGLDDDDLMRLAPGRTGTLAAELDASGEPRHRAAAARLAIWRDRAATLTPFAFYTRLLGADGGRKALLARLGPEAGDVVDEFMALTLAHERDGAPSLLTFLARLEGTDLSIKRDMEHAGNAVRVMTVHAAKGLEAKIVFLPDTCGAPTGQHDPKIFRLDGSPDMLVWSPQAEGDPARVAQARAAGREAALDEHRRLLYVALTRAEERLYIAGFHGKRGPVAGCWHDMIMAAGLRDELEPIPAPWDRDETILRRGDAFPPAATPAQGAMALAPGAALPAWITRPAPRETPLAPPLRPSRALAAADQADGSDDEDVADRTGLRRRQAMALGRLAHRLLQHLPDVPAARRRDAALRYLGTRGRALAPDQHAGLVDQALRVLDDPALQVLFGPGSRAEVAVAAKLSRPDGGSLDVSGQIDRIGIDDAAVWIADFKTGRPRPAEETPPSYVAQLALYRAAVQPLYPDRACRAFLVWTEGPAVTELAVHALDAAMDRIMDDRG